MNKSVCLTYSGDDFALPPNLFVIGTMNTADRSIALVDAAMRRRFAFVELSPRADSRCHSGGRHASTRGTTRLCTWSGLSWLTRPSSMPSADCGSTGSCST